MKSIIIAIVLLLNGCASTSEPNLLKGELYVHKNKSLKREVVHRIELDDDNIYSFEIRFR